MSEWRTMESVPKDGTLILAYASLDGLERRRSHMFVLFWCIKDPWVAGWEIYGGGFAPFEPTHWQPLPQPPKMEE